LYNNVHRWNTIVNEQDEYTKKSTYTKKNKIRALSPVSFCEMRGRFFLEDLLAVP